MTLVLPPNGEEDFEELDDPGLNPDILRRRRERVLTVMALLLILGVSVFTSYRLLRAPGTSPKDLVAVAQQAVKDGLPAGMALSFSSLRETLVEPVDGGSYEVSAEVLALTPAGASQHYVFTCTLTLFPDRHWRPSKLVLTAQ